MAKLKIAMVRGEDKEFTLTIFREGGDPSRNEDREDLAGATVTLHVKLDMDDPGSPLFVVSTGSGVTHQAQIGDTLGKADVKIASALTAGRAASTYVMDGWVTRTNGDKKPIFKNADLVISERVGLP